MKYPRIFCHVSVDISLRNRGYFIKYPWMFEFLYIENFVFGQMFGDFTEFSVEFSRRESWQYFAALCQSQPIYELSPIGNI